MSDTNLIKKLSQKRRAFHSSRAPRPSTSAAAAVRRRTRLSGEKKWRRPSEKFKAVKRSKSEPWLWKPGGGGGGDVMTAAEEEDEDVGVLYRPRTCTDIFSSPENLAPRSPGNFSERYNKDTKVVINVTVEGSPGPIRTMVKLGSNVEDITKLVVNKYNEEGRTPQLDKKSYSAYELHHSYFSLEGLSKSDLIADVGSRSFYLRRRSCSDVTSASSNQLEALSLPFLPTFINRKLRKVMRKTRKVWKIFGCIPCAG